ncbi:hypothetical protein Tco_0057925 [Tanacetum coccineum]
MHRSAFECGGRQATSGRNATVEEQEPGKWQCCSQGLCSGSCRAKQRNNVVTDQARATKEHPEDNIGVVLKKEGVVSAKFSPSVNFGIPKIVKVMRRTILLIDLELGSSSVRSEDLDGHLSAEGTMSLMMFETERTGIPPGGRTSKLNEVLEIEYRHHSHRPKLTDKADVRTIQTSNDMLRACVIRALEMVASEWSFFKVGDKRVCLKVSPWKGVVRFGKRGKLNPRYVGPFKVIKRVGDVAYKLELPEDALAEFVRHFKCQLKKCHADEPLLVSLDGLHFDDKLQFVEEPFRDHRCEVKRLKTMPSYPLVKVSMGNSREVQSLHGNA